MHPVLAGFLCVPVNDYNLINQFAPRYKDLKGRSENAFIGFNSASHYQNFLTRPNQKVNVSLVIKEWPNIQRIMASLALKETTQSIIISKLSSYERKNRTQKAMWEIDSIIRSFYMLDFIDNVTIRRNVQWALKRGEAYHQLRRAISLANFGRLKARTELEQQLWNECARLIANCIIFYNATLLSNLLAIKEKQGLLDEADLIKRVSPVAWQHINLRGRYRFRNQSHKLEFDEIIANLSQYSFAKSKDILVFN